MSGAEVWTRVEEILDGLYENLEGAFGQAWDDSAAYAHQESFDEGYREGYDNGFAEGVAASSGGLPRESSD